MDDIKNDTIRDLMNVELFPIIETDVTALSKIDKFPISQVGALGVAFEPVAAVLKRIGSKPATPGGSGIYKVVLEKGTHLAEKDGQYLGTIIKDKKGLQGQARFTQLAENGTASINPAMLCAAAVLMSINKKLDVIQETQDEIYAFLEEKEKAKQKGNLSILIDILKNYKYNWNNATYKSNKHIQVQEIKREAEQSLILLSGQTEKALKKQSFIHGDGKVDEKIEKIDDIFHNYQFALYVYAFSSFLEIMLLENFEEGYLRSVVQVIEEHAKRFADLYIEIADEIEKYSKSSVQSVAVKALSGISKGLGGIAAKIPGVNKSQLDENLIESGKKLEMRGVSKAINTVGKILSGDTTFISPFIENINTVNRTYNSEIVLYFDSETLYIDYN